MKFLFLLETICRHTTLVDDHLVNFEIMDTAGQVMHCENELISNTLTKTVFFNLFSVAIHFLH